MRPALILIAVAFLSLAIRGMAPVSAWGGWGTLWLFGGFALVSCLGTAWKVRREAAHPVLRDPVIYLLLAHFPLWAFVYFSLGAHHGPDASNHLEYIRSAVLDHDLDIRNDDAIFGGASANDVDPTQINMHGIGPAFLWAPLYVVANSLCGVVGQACNGASRIYLAACTLTSMFLSSVGLVLCYQLALRFATRGAAFLATLGIAWGTFLYWYLTGEPTMSHNLSFATAALVFFLIERGPQGARGYLLVGLAVGFSASVRFANAVLGAAALPGLLFPRVIEPRSELVKKAAALGFGAFLAFLPQMFAWQQIFGSPLLMPNGEGFLDRPPALLDILFSPLGGLFTWSPLLYLAIPGLLAVRRLGGRTLFGFWSVILLLYVTNARVPDWWGGSSFGNRRFCTILPAMAVGMAITFDALARLARRRPLLAPATVVSVAVLWNVLLAQAHREGAWPWGAAVGFPQMTRVVADELGRGIGSPLSLPGAIVDSVRTGQSLRDYEASVLSRSYSTFVLRFGDDDLIYLKHGFSVAQGTGDFLHRTTADGTVEVSLFRAEDYRLGIRLRGHEEQVLEIEVNGAPAGSCPMARDLEECEITIPAGRLRPGPNTFRLKVRFPSLPESDVQLHAFVLKPAGSGKP